MGRRARQARVLLTSPWRIPGAIRRRLRARAHRDAYAHFHSPNYVDVTSRRLEHLASLGLPLANRSVLEVGAGIGDLTGFFLARGCTVTATDARPLNVEILAQRRPEVDAFVLDLDADESPRLGPFDVVFAYGLLYHLAAPERALERLAGWCGDVLLLETIVAPGADVSVTEQSEPTSWPTQSAHGMGSRPTRGWVLEQLRRHFAFVYVTRTQPWGVEFPLDWRQPPSERRVRTVFVAARSELDSPVLATELPGLQTRD